MGSPHISMGIALFLFFSVTHKIGLFSPNPTLSGQARVRAGAHPARVGARLHLDAPRRGGNGGGVGSDMVAGGAGADWATCLSLLERAAAAAADIARDGAASTAASSTRVGGVSLRV